MTQEQAQAQPLEDEAETLENETVDVESAETGSVQEDDPEQDVLEQDVVEEDILDEDAIEEDHVFEESASDDEGSVEDSVEDDTAEQDEKEDVTSSADDLRLLEAVLFASVEPLSTNAIRERVGKDKDIGGMLMQLKENYAGRGVHLVEMDGYWAFRTAGDLGDALEVTKEVQRKLSRAAMETLAIVAYHQPVTRAEIENIRGVATHKGTLDVLMESGWVKPGRRRETPGRPLTWVTTTTFMDHFGLESMNDLPGLDDLKASGLLDRRPAIDTIPGTGNLFGDDESDIEADAAADGEDVDDDDNYDEKLVTDTVEETSADDGEDSASDDDDGFEDSFEDDFEDDFETEPAEEEEVY